jgi:ADP-dependent NAD(P)H-hydrate dehydratase / NAD(P)H-hydrate epimerase
MQRIAELIDRVLAAPEDEAVLAAVKASTRRSTTHIRGRRPLTPEASARREITMTVRVTTAAQAAARDAAAIAAGTPSIALMQTAGGAAARWILAHYPAVRTDGALCVAGSGNNGGDAWVVAGVLAAAGCPVGVVEAAPPSTDDAKRAREDVRPRLAEAHEPARPAVIVDGLLGTGATGEIRESYWPHLELMAQHRASGAAVVALDVPSGIDATTGAGGTLCAR